MVVPGHADRGDARVPGEPLRVLRQVEEGEDGGPVPRRQPSQQVLLIRSQVLTDESLDHADDGIARLLVEVQRAIDEGNSSGGKSGPRGECRLGFAHQTLEAVERRVRIVALIGRGVEGHALSAHRYLDSLGRKPSPQDHRPAHEVLPERRPAVAHHAPHGVGTKQP